MNVKAYEEMKNFIKENFYGKDFYSHATFEYSIFYNNWRVQDANCKISLCRKGVSRVAFGLKEYPDTIFKINFLRNNINYCESEVDNYDEAINMGIEKGFAKAEYAGSMVIQFDKNDSEADGVTELFCESSAEENSNSEYYDDESYDGSYDYNSTDSITRWMKESDCYNPDSNTCVIKIYAYEKVPFIYNDNEYQNSEEYLRLYNSRLTKRDSHDNDYLDSFFDNTGFYDDCEGDMTLCFSIYYGESFMEQLAELCQNCSINDLHSGNFGFREDFSPVIIDYAGY